MNLNDALTLINEIELTIKTKQLKEDIIIAATILKSKLTKINELKTQTTSTDLARYITEMDDTNEYYLLNLHDTNVKQYIADDYDEQTILQLQAIKDDTYETLLPVIKRINNICKDIQLLDKYPDVLIYHLHNNLLLLTNDLLELYHVIDNVNDNYHA